MDAQILTAFAANPEWWKILKTYREWFHPGKNEPDVLFDVLSGINQSGSDIKQIANEAAYAMMKRLSLDLPTVRNIELEQYAQELENANLILRNDLDAVSSERNDLQQKVAALEEALSNQSQAEPTVVPSVVVDVYVNVEDGDEVHYIYAPSAKMIVAMPGSGGHEVVEALPEAAQKIIWEQGVMNKLENLRQAGPYIPANVAELLYALGEYKSVLFS